MLRFPIRLKLGFLAGVPVAGAIVLSVLVLTDARDRVEKARALGSIEDLARLSGRINVVLAELQVERAWTAYEAGLRMPSPTRLVAEGEREGADATERRTASDRLNSQYGVTDTALERLRGFLATRDLSQFPDRLRRNLVTAERSLGGLGPFREGVARRDNEALAEWMSFYGQATGALVSATAALTELSDDGALLRTITALVSLLEIKERASQEHALLSFAFASGEFAPGSFRDLVTTISEAETHTRVLLTLSSADQVAYFQARRSQAAWSAAEALRQSAIDAADSEPAGSASVWFEAQDKKVVLLGEVARHLNEEVKRAALAKIAETEIRVRLSLALAVCVVLGSAALGWWIARGLVRSVLVLQRASRAVAEGDLDTQVTLTTRDEFATLGTNFNDMVGELRRAQGVLSEQVRMASELEIAASLQLALLPRKPQHPDFEFAGRMIAADEVGGDFYDVLHDEATGALWVTIGDVSNHGLGAGLVMLMTQSAFGALFYANPASSPDQVYRRVNALVQQNVATRLRESKYVTAQLLAYRQNGDFDCAGGHEWPVVYRASTQSCEVLEAPGPWLGIVRELPEVPVSRLHLAPGDVLCLYSDGITESRDDQGEQFDVERLQRTLAGLLRSKDDLNAAADGVIAAARAHAAHQDDDWSLLLVRRVAA